jgi:hypothetical protein
MKLGPIHVIRDVTFRKLRGLDDQIQRFHRALSQESADGNALADRVFEHAHGLLHSPLGVRAVESVPADDPQPPTADDLAAVERVATAYSKAMSDGAAPPAPSLWDHIAGAKPEFHAALARQDVPAAAAALSRMFVTDLTWGLGHVHASHPELLRQGGLTHLHVTFADMLVCLAEAVGVARLTSMHQEPGDHLHPLDRDLDELYDSVLARVGFDLTFPRVGCGYGFRVAGKFVTLDGLVHGYTAHRLRQLGGAGATVFEIGGGYGGLALLAHRAGLTRYAIFDLPWVNALQGYFLIRSLPPGSVRLYGESAGDLRVLPYWALDAEPERSCDVLVNTDSMPEMGRATAAGYLPKIHRVTRGVFLSINQEAKAGVPGVGEQNCVRELVDEFGAFVTLSRHRAWMRQGYAEEVLKPRDDVR